MHEPLLPLHRPLEERDDRVPEFPAVIGEVVLREARFDAAACDRYYQEIEKELGMAGVCGFCLWVCPHGRKKGKKGDTARTG